MPKINLETEPRFKEAMKSLGFKKTSREFVKPYKDALQCISIGYATNGEHHVRYYSPMCSLCYPLIESVAMEAGIITYPMGCPIGYVMPQKTGLVEWRLEDSATDYDYLHVATDIVNAIRDYAVPFLEAYSTLKDFIKGIEEGTVNREFYDKKAVPIAYYLIGERQKAFDYIAETLEAYKRQAAPMPFHEHIITEEYEKDVYNCNQDGNLRVYQDFADKFTKWVNQKGNDTRATLLTVLP